MSKIRYIMAGLCTGLIGLGAAAFLFPADIRPDGFDAHDASARERGLAVLERGVEAQGGWATWRRTTDLDVELQDTWHVSAFRLYMPLADDDVSLRGEIPLHQFGRNSTWTVTSGEAKNERFGVVDSQGWYGEPGAFTGPGTRFYAMTMEYLATLAFRVHEADVIAWIDVVERNGEPHDRVFVTWESAEPSAFVDQYILYFRQSDGLLTAIECTVRDFGPFITGAVDYLDWSDVGGLRLPSRYVMPLIDLGGPHVHTVELRARPL